MAKLYLDLSVLDATDPVSPYRLGAGEIMTRSGVNLGNFAFRHAMRFILRDLAAFRISDYTAFLDAQRAGEAIDQVILSCANWLGTSPADEKNNLFRANVIEAAQAPAVCFGLGVQAPDGVEVLELGPNTRRLAEVLSERASAISVRDEVTRRSLERVGVHNCVVTGCPSNFINPDTDLGARISARAADLAGEAESWQALRMAFCEYSGGSPASGRMLKFMLRMMGNAPAFLLLQSPTLLSFVLGDTSEVPEPYQKHSPFEENERRLRSVLRGKTLFFSSIAAWMDFTRTCDLSCGMRLHGNMVAMQSGVPSLLVSHDSRTAGLAEVMGVPTVPVSAFVDGYRAGPRPALELIAGTMARYDARRRELAGVMCDYVAGNGLSAHPSLLRLAERD